MALITGVNSLTGHKAIKEGGYTMTKKHFVSLANVLKDEASRGRSFTDWQIDLLADFCQHQNSRFNRERWIAYIKGECGKNGGKVKYQAVTA
jgi:hypothetical protein